MDIASLCPLPVGVLAWRSPRPALSVIVKMTLSVGDAEPSLLDPQERLSLDRPSSIGAPHELLYASDFVPKKARCDVLLTGHARSPMPSRRIPVRIRAGEAHRAFFALAAEASSQIPLSATYLRSGESASSGHVSVGPMDALSPARAKLLSRATLGPGGVPLAPLPPDFNFAAFNAAPVALQIERLPSVIELDGLLPGLPRRKIVLPSERPRVYAWVKDRRSLREVPLRCDTLWIDADRALCSLVFRGVIELEGEGNERPNLALTLAAFGLPERISDLERRLEGAPRVRAAEASDLLGAASAIHPIEDETTKALEAEPAVETPRPRRGLGALGGMRLGGSRRAPAHDDDEKTTFRALPVRQPATADDEAADELAAEEILEVDEVEEIEPEVMDDIADEPTPIPAGGLRPLSEGWGDSLRIQPPVLKRTTFVLEESTQTNFQIPQRSALPFEMDRPSPIPAAPDSTDRRPSYSDLPFQVVPPSVVAAPSAEAPESEKKTTESAVQNTPPNIPDALPFKSRRKATLVNPPVLLDEVRSALPFVKAPVDAAREALPISEPPSGPPVLPFVKVASDAPRDVMSPPEPPLPVLPFITAKKTLAMEAPRDVPSDPSSALPFIKPAAAMPSVPVVAPSDIPSALPFTKPAAAPPEASAPPSWVPSGLPFVKSAPEAASFTASAPAAFSFLSQLKPVEPAAAPSPSPPSAEDNNSNNKNKIEITATKPLLPMETYAAIQVDLWDEGALLEDVLARHGMDEITWRDNEQRRADALAEEAKQGRSEVALALAEALDAAAARRALSDPKTLSLDDYLAVRVAIEDAPEPEPVLARKNLTELQWQNLDRQWRKRAKTDASLAKEIREKLAELRKAAAAPPPPPPKAKPSPKRKKSRARAA